MVKNFKHNFNIKSNPLNRSRYRFLDHFLKDSGKTKTIKRLGQSVIQSDKLKGKIYLTLGKINSEQFETQSLKSKTYYSINILSKKLWNYKQFLDIIWINGSQNDRTKSRGEWYWNPHL